MIVAVAVVFWIGVVMGTVTVVKMWRETEDHWSYRQAEYWFWSERGWRAYRRATLPFLLFVFAAAVGLTFTSVAPYFGMVAVFGFVPLILSTAFFNWPKFVVPPRLRAEKGWLAERSLQRNQPER